MENMGTFLLAIALAIIVSSGTYNMQKNALTGVDAAFAQEDWKLEFENVCSRTQDAMLLNVDELRSLIARCDKLKSPIETLPETQRKVYLRRLRDCRELYVFVLDSKDKK